MKKKFLYFFQIFFTILILIPNQSLADSNTITSDSSTQQDIDGDGEFLTVKDNSTLATGATTKAANVTADSVDVTVESGSTISANTVAVFGDNTSDLTVTNSGTITASGITAIDVKGTTDATITNSSGGTISSNRNTIRISKTGSNNTTGMTITNSGTITANIGSAIFASDGNSTATITNKIGGEITNSDASNATIRAGASSTIVNSGTIKNDVDNDAIKLYGNNATITLKDGGIVVGKIDGLLRTGSKLKFNHGVGQGYFYETEGDFTLEDLDGNQVVKGSAGSVGQGGNENIDELLGYKSLNIRKSLNKFLKSEGFKNKKTEWQGIQATSLERKENTKNLALGYEFYSLGVNIIRPLENENIIASFEYSEQDFQKDHDITRYNISFGVHFNESENKFKDNSFILAGATLNEGKRKILTNTTTSGTLDISDKYESFEIHTGKIFKNKSLLPNIGTNLSYSFTPSHTESKYYSWEDKHVANFSVDLNDEYNLEFKKNKSKIGIGWILDYRTLITDSKTEYSVNGTEATYHQDDELIKEMTLSVNINYEKTFYKFGKMLVSIDGKSTTQDVSSIGANISFVKVL